MKKCLLILVFTLTSFATAQPYEPHVLWDRSGAGEESYYGVRIVPQGDQNEDGYSDFAVWAYGSGSPGQASEALIEFFHGGNPVPQEPYMTYAINPEFADNRMAIAGMGDVNGDGFQDWAIWVRYLSDLDSYAVELLWGGPDSDLIPDLTFKIPIGTGSAGPVGDFNGDGFDDIYRYFYPPLDYSEIFFGGDPPDLIPDWIRHSPPGSRYQASPDSYGDVNGDGFADFVSSTPSPENMTYIFLGGASPDTVPVYVWTNFYSSENRIVNSLNADGISDLAFGRPGAQVDIHFGGNSLFTTPNYTLNFQPGCASRRIFPAGDVNNDGYRDLVVLDDACNNLWGTLSVYLGHPWLNSNPVVTIQGRTLPLNLIGIRTAAGLGDVNGDGVNDFAIGAANTNFDGQRGRVVVLSGDTSLHVATDPHRPELPREFQVMVYPNPFNGSTTIDLTLPAYSRQTSLAVYNLLGEKVFSIVLAASGGKAVCRYDAGNLASGLYLLQVSSGNFKTTTKLMLLR